MLLSLEKTILESLQALLKAGILVFAIWMPTIIAREILKYVELS